MENKTNCKLQAHSMNQHLRPLLNAMTMFGLYSTNHTKNTCHVLLKVYDVIVLVFLVLNAVNFMGIDLMLSSDSSFYAKLSYCSLFFLSNVCNLVTALVLCISCLRRKGLPSLLETWRFSQDSENSGISHRQMSIFVRFCVGVAVVSILFGMLLSILNVVKLWEDVSLFQRTRAISMSFTTCYQLSTWSLSTSLVLLVSVALWGEFKDFNTDFKSRIKFDGEFCGDLGKYRRRHQRICQLVETVDNIFSPILGVGLATATTQLLLSLYLAVWGTGSDYVAHYTLVMGYWAVCSVINVFVFSLCGILVNGQAHGALSTLYNIDVSRNTDIVVEWNMLWSRLSGESIGLTAMKMFTINKSTIMTISGLLLSYYLVLVQFQTASISPYTTHENCTR